jgi:type IV secretion system protein VirD4
MLRNWWGKNKKFIIVMGIICVLLSLFLIPAISRTSYEIKTIKANPENKKNNFQLVQELFPDILKAPFKNLGMLFDNQEIKQTYNQQMKTFGIIYLVAVIFLKIKLSSRSEYANIEHGSSDWSKNGEEYSVISPKEGFILAEREYLPVIPDPPKAKNGNILVIGGSGSGKSAGFVIPNALQMLGSYIFTDPKGELYDRTAGFYKQNGYQVHVINLADPRLSDGYNPLSHIRNTTDVDIISKIISDKDSQGGGKKSSDPFWDQTAEALLSAAIYYILLNRPEEERSLASCGALIKLGGENEGETLKQLFMQLPFDNPARKNFEMIRLGSEKTFSNILVSLSAKLKAFESEEIAALTATNTINFEELAERKSVVYVITPESHNTYDFLMTIFFSQLFQRLYEFGDRNGGKLPVPIFFVLDEFANIGRIPNFERVISTCRSKRLHISVILQSIDQLMEIYDEKVTENIMANCSTHLFLGSNAQKTLETFSKQLGEKTITKDTKSISKDKNSNTTGASYSDQSMARALMTPDELRRLDPNDCIILIQGMRPIKALKYWYFKVHPKRLIAKQTEISHLDIEQIKRGKFKITNPYDIINSTPIYEEVDIQVENNINNKKEEIPVNSDNQDQEYDIQAELEKKFDELFGEKKANV